jgi:hypothetical protein
MLLATCCSSCWCCILCPRDSQGWPGLLLLQGRDGRWRHVGCVGGWEARGRPLLLCRPTLLLRLLLPVAGVVLACLLDAGLLWGFGGRCLLLLTLLLLTSAVLLVIHLRRMHSSCV